MSICNCDVTDELCILDQPGISIPEPSISLPELEKILHQGDWRVQGLEWCNKDDDCHRLARGARLVMEDIRFALEELLKERENG